MLCDFFLSSYDACWTVELTFWCSGRSNDVYGDSGP